MKRDQQGTKQEFTMPQTPFVDPRLATNPAAARYAAGLAARKGGQPVAGGPTPPIPVLDSPAVEGMTMSQQALLARQQQAPGLGIIPPENMPQAASAPQAPGAGLTMTDTLPEIARQDPNFREGQGSMFAMSQPHLANKYGVIRGGRHIPPQALHGGAPGLRPETVEGLKALEDFNRKRQQLESPEAGSTAAAEKAATEGTAGEVAKLADPSANPSAKPVTQEEVEKAVQNMDDFDFDTFRDVIMKDILNNNEQKEIVEARLTPLDLGEIIDKGVITQRIPIVPGKYEITLQSVTGEEELAMKRLLMLEKGKVEAPDRYLLDKFRLMMVALGLRAVNNRILPDHRDAQGNFNDELFWKKFNIVLKLPFHMLASIATHYYYFDIRVRGLFRAIKNG